MHPPAGGDRERHAGPCWGWRSGLLLESLPTAEMSLAISECG